MMHTKVAEGLEAWIDYSTGFRPSHVRSELESCIEDLRLVHSRREIISRKIGSDVLNRLPFWIYRPITTVLKGALSRRKTAAKPGFNGERSRFMSAYSRLRGRVGAGFSQLTVCLTHDVDTKLCYDHWLSTMDIEESLGLRSVWNVLTAGPYRLEASRIDETLRRGFEIGLHGDTHDMAIGYRNLRRVEARLKRSLDLIGVQVSGYRAPALGFSEPLLELLSDLGFSYDSSIKLKGFFSKGVDVCIPYCHPKARLWELPLALSDDSLLREHRLDDEGVIRAVRKVGQRIEANNGLLVFNSHPVNMIGREELYRKILLVFKNEFKARIVLPGDLVAALNLQPMEDQWSISLDPAA